MKNKPLLPNIKHLIQAESLQESLEIAWQILGNPCFVVDMNQNILAYSDVEVNDPFWNQIVLQRQLTRNFIDEDPAVLSEHAAAFYSEDALLFKPDFTSVEQIKKALVFNRERLGLFMVIADKHPFAKKDLEATNVIGDILAYKMLSHVGFIHLQSVQKNTFFSSLIDGAEYSEEQLRIRLEMLKIPQKKYFFLCILKNRAEENLNTPLINALQPDFRFDIFSETLKGYSFMYHYSAAILVPSDDPNDGIFESSSLKKLLENNHLTIGVSTWFRDISALRIFYEQAEKALQIGSILYPEKQVLHYDHIFLFDLVDQLPPEDLGNYIHQDILKLHQYDLDNKTELCRTLFIYLENNHSLSRTAEELFLHKNTINYRINQCKELLNTDLKANKRNLIYVFSLAILLKQNKD